MCNYPQQNDIWLETSGGEGARRRKKTHTHNLRSMDMTLHKLIHGNQRNLCAWHIADMFFFLKLVLFGADAGVIFMYFPDVGRFPVPVFLYLLVINMSGKDCMSFGKSSIACSSKFLKRHHLVQLLSQVGFPAKFEDTQG